ncbi:MAG: OmpA family protein [Bdellovibrionales bacterium]|nr:OmpA family protein [Bdellovibrionales bacterium]
MTQLFTIFLYLIVISCTTLKEDKNQLTGAEASDISSQDIDSDNKGSDSGTIDGLSTVYFAYDSSTLSEETRQTLMENLSWIQSHSEVSSLELEGHCDTMGSEAYNVGLGRRRAEAVKSFLVEQGIDSSRLSVISYGEERPLSEVDHSKNRRVNFVPMY